MYAYVERGVAVYIYCLRTLCLLMCVGGGDLYLLYVYLCGGGGGGGGLYLQYVYTMCTYAIYSMYILCILTVYDRTL